MEPEGWELVCVGGLGMCGPVVMGNGTIVVASLDSGELFTIAHTQDDTLPSSLELLAHTDGVPAALAAVDGKTLFVADLAKPAVLRRNGADGSLEEFVSEYEARRFKGPSAICVDASGNMYFTDSGPLGESTLTSRSGSVFTVSRDGQLLQPIALECLAHPSGVAMAPNDSALFVTEMLMNRLLRAVQRPAGVWHCSVFYQFSGSLGPSAVACDADGVLYVALYDMVATGSPGRIVVLSPRGALLRELTLPAPEVSGLAVDVERGLLYVTESSSNSLFRLAIADLNLNLS